MGADEEAKAKEALNNTLKEYIAEWKKTREKEEEELKKLKEKQAKRKEIRAEQEKKLNQQKKEEEKKLRKKKRRRRKKKKSKHCFSANKNSLIFAINSRHPVITSDCQPTHSGRECFKFVQKLPM